MAVSYQSRFFNFWRQQWQRWQQQWQRQKWQVESTLQVIGAILAQFWQRGLPQLMGSVSQMRQRLLPKPTAAPPADEALLSVMSALSLTKGDDESWVVAIAPIARSLTWWQRWIAPWQRWFQPQSKTLAPQDAPLAQRQPFYLACDRAEKSLLLVDEAACPLKTFTATEQQQIEQHIAYALAVYYQHVRQWYRRRHHWLWGWQQRSLKAGSNPPSCLVGNFLGQLQLTGTSEGDLVLPRVSPLAAVLHWLRSRLPFGRKNTLSQVRVQGIATLLGTQQMVLIGTDNTILYTLNPTQQAQVLAWIERHFNPFKLPFQDWLSQLSYWLGGFSAVTSPLLAATDPLPVFSPVEPLLSLGRSSDSLAHSPPSETAATSVHPNPEQLILDVDAALIGYELHWFERLLLWCDRLFLWIEEHLIRLGRWLLQQWQR
ncbi:MULTISPECIES: hypothetical protein [unclassified Thermosynechococcus]|uniref:hypothetical protein n=1 Tax=unclassified Thermosynechococcus TaxID=2622553 RepID=UPI0019E79AC3|nr:MULTISPECIES: hypothetical protein [unclassified Thermosynechococcus]HIK35557.1 hypothetical protein [Thermosynechococcus sp. M98_K2018_005]HIK47861.1 hypothetical protein [Thermosynechococcus sp. M55_K2018_012]